MTAAKSEWTVGWASRVMVGGDRAKQEGESVKSRVREAVWICLVCRPLQFEVFQCKWSAGRRDESSMGQ